MSARRPPGVLCVVATPLGNLGDLSQRARDALSTADWIAAEDTRRTGLLLSRLGIEKKPFLSYYSGRGERSSDTILEKIKQGQTVVLVTDGGTPGISDPGSRLVQNVRAAGFRIEVIPGPTAIGMVMSVSSMAGGSFVFEGFLPSHGAKRRRRLRELHDDVRPCVYFEAPHRIRESLEDMVLVFGADRLVTMVREGTKIHEEIFEGPLGALLQGLPTNPKGEFTLVVEGNPTPSNHISVDPSELVRLIEAMGTSKESAARRVAEHFGLPRSHLLRIARGEEPSVEANDE